MRRILFAASLLMTAALVAAPAQAATAIEYGLIAAAIDPEAGTASGDYDIDGDFDSDDLGPLSAGTETDGSVAVSNGPAGSAVDELGVSAGGGAAAADSFFDIFVDVGECRYADGSTSGMYHVAANGGGNTAGIDSFFDVFVAVDPADPANNGIFIAFGAPQDPRDPADPAVDETVDTPAGTVRLTYVALDLGY